MTPATQSPLGYLLLLRRCLRLLGYTLPLLVLIVRTLTSDGVMGYLQMKTSPCHPNE